LRKELLILADIKWIKLSVGLPDNKKIKQIRKLPNGDTIALMWVFLMCLAGETNDDGAIYFTPEIPFTDEMLADQFAIDVNTVRLALNTFERFGMIEIIDDVIHLEAWEKWQATDKLSEIREQTRKRVAKHREKKLLESNEKCNVTVTLRNATEEDKEKEVEEDKEKEIYSTIVSYLNEKAGTAYRATTAKTKTLIKARLAEGFNIDDFKTVIDKKCADWLNNAEYEKYLRPETLFGTKFEGYLNAKGKGVTNGTDKGDSGSTEYKIGLWL
jgi:predicted phage replisome organizer/uncharacterized phage protein (TIGR02220 family)